MNFSLRAIISVLVISTVSCSEESPTGPLTTTTVRPLSCPYDISDIDEVVNHFYTDKAEATVKVENVLKTQQVLMRDLTCIQTTPAPTASPGLLSGILAILFGSSKSVVECVLPPPDVSAVAQFGRYFDGNQRAIEVMKLEAERIFHLLSLEDPNSKCACEIKGRTIAAVNSYGYGIVGCTNDSVVDLNANVGKIQASVCVDKKLTEFFTNYKINNAYFTAESALRKCKTKFIDSFYAELASINAAIEGCVTESICTAF